MLIIKSCVYIYLHVYAFKLIYAFKTIKQITTNPLAYLYTTTYLFSTVQSNVASHQVSLASVSLPFLPWSLLQTENVFSFMYFSLLETSKNWMDETGEYSRCLSTIMCSSAKNCFTEYENVHWKLVHCSFVESMSCGYTNLVFSSSPFFSS